MSSISRVETREATIILSFDDLGYQKKGPCGPKPANLIQLHETLKGIEGIQAICHLD